MRSIAEKIGCTTETLRSWVKNAEATADPRRNTALADRERVKQLERENAELKRANEILRKASAFFAQAELDRRGK
jgi:transposase-like protein